MKYTYNEFIDLLDKFPEQHKVHMAQRHKHDILEYMQSEGVTTTLIAIAKKCQVKEHAYQIAQMFLDQFQTLQEARKVGRALGKWAKMFEHNYVKANKKDANEAKQTPQEFLRFLKSLPKNARRQAIEFHIEDIRHFMKMLDQEKIEFLSQMLTLLAKCEDAFHLARLFQDAIRTPNDIKKIGDLMGDKKTKFYEDMDDYWSLIAEQPVKYPNYEDFLASIAIFGDIHLKNTFLEHHKKDTARFVAEKGFMQVFNDILEANSKAPESCFRSDVKHEVAEALAHTVTSVELMNEVGELLGEHAGSFYFYVDLYGKNEPAKTSSEIKVSRSHSSIFRDKTAEPAAQQQASKRQRLSS